MRVNSLGSNKTEISTDNMLVFVSYQTPVAAIIDGRAYRTQRKWSVTTSKHINQRLGGRVAEEKPQAFFDSLLETK